jgi:hypothetical protein
MAESDFAILSLGSKLTGQDDFLALANFSDAMRTQVLS